MTHFSLLAQANNQNDLRAMLIPFFEYGFGEFDQEVKPYLEWATDEDGTKYLHNPNAKWDWYVVGGRFSNRLITKSGQHPDYCLVRDLDISAMQARNLRERTEQWDNIAAQLATVNVTVRDYFESDRDTRTAIYYRVASNTGDHELAFFEPLALDRENHLTLAQRRALTFALLDKDGWLERGSMGWFGKTSENDTFDVQFYERLGKLSPDSRVYMVDCHI